MLNNNLRPLLDQIAPYEPISQDEQGGCVWCAGKPPGTKYGNAGRFLTDHNYGCPWVDVRQMLGDTIPYKRN